ncbi:STT3 domain-containing protein [Candidatus Methanocrinis alkalitolerans]|uniref:STT3 domain-containing protein n=1 Tax=Candidatus Methanocrinis alkalitolerans TaxID=3033395 RepID=UPI002935036C|nr:STT3 domain-containing protein [Candidatus Methanocrinis alkalitolerans]
MRGGSPGLDRGEVQEVAGVFAVTLLGLLVRLAPMRGALVGGDVLFYGSDSYYHMRRVLYTVEHFPSTLWFDPYLNYPKGMELLWPPLFDQLIAGTALLLGAGSQRSVEMVGAIVPPILGSLAIVSLYLLARALFGRRVALLSALFFALNPHHASASIFGRPDHHVFETFLLVNILLFLVLALKSKDKRLFYAACSGVFMASLAYTWIGAGAYIGTFLVYIAIQATLHLRRRTSSEDDLSIFLAAFGVCLILMIPFWKEAWLTPSFFTAAALLLMTSIILLLSRTFRERDLPWPAFLPAVAALGYLLLIAAYALGPSMGASLLFNEALSYFFGGSLSHKVAEAAPLYAAVRPLSVTGFNLTIAVMGFACLWRSNIDKDQLLFLVWTVSILIFALFQNRFLYVLSASMSVLMPLFFFRAVAIFDASRWGRSEDLSRYFGPALLILLLIPSAATVSEGLSVRPAIVEDGWDAPLLWLAENSMETRSFGELEEAPEYGVLCWWDRGNWILYRSKRPVVANGFQAGAEDAARFFLSGGETEAKRILDERRSRYVVTDSKMVGSGLSAIPLWIGEEPTDYVRNDGAGRQHTEKFMRTTLARCHLYDCREMSHLRLIYESEPMGSASPADQVKIFEVVAGARIVVASGADEEIIATLNLTTNQGRLFQYAMSGTAQNGRCELIVPYSTEGGGAVRALGPYIISSGGERKLVFVAEEEVIHGRVMMVEL